MPAFVRALFIKTSTNVELSYYIKKKRAHRAFPYNMVNHAVPTEKLCMPFGLHPVVEKVSIFKHLYNTTQAAHLQDDSPNFGTKNFKPTLLGNSLEHLNIRYKLIKPYTPRHKTSNGNLPSENALTIIFLSSHLTGNLRTTPKANPAAARQTHHSRPHSVKRLYFVSVHPMQKQQKLDIRLPPDAYAETHNMPLYLKYSVKNALSFSNGMMSI